MSSYFYDGQVKRFLTQFMRAMSNFSYKDARGNIIQVPVRYGDMNRQVAQILKKNSENTIPSAPFIACYIKDMQFDRTRLQDPTFISKVNIRERETDKLTGDYLNTQGANYTVERMMPTPYLVTFAADIWTTNTDQKFQIWEQITVIFNPSLEIQSTDNYLDWTSLSVLNRDSEVWSSRQIPQGVEQDIDILNMTFKAPIWITPPAKVKKLGIITKIISNVFTVQDGTISSETVGEDSFNTFNNPATTVVVTPGNFDLLVLDNVANLLSVNVPSVDGPQPDNVTSWYSLLDLYPGTFRAGLSQIRLSKPEGGEIVAYISLDPTDETKMLLNFDADTVPGNTILSGRGTVDAIVNPETFNPKSPAVGIRYLILEGINQNSEFGLPGYSGPVAWKNSNNTDFQAAANDIIQWNGTSWSIVFDSTAITATTYITNIYTGVQYKWDGEQWSKSFEGIYDKLAWRLVL